MRHAYQTLEKARVLPKLRFWVDSGGYPKSIQKSIQEVVPGSILFQKYPGTGKVKRYLKSIQKVLPGYPRTTFKILFKYCLTFLGPRIFLEKMRPGCTF